MTYSDELGWTTARHRRGNMLLLCVAVGMLMLVVVALAFWVYLHFFSNQLLQDSSEKIALTAAQRLNDNNYSGKINNLIGGSRELVYCARQMHAKTVSQPNFSEYEPFAAQILAESREGARTLTIERDRYVAGVISDLRGLAQNSNVQPARELALFDASSDRPEITDFKVGSLENMESNVVALKGLPDLLEHDTTQNYFKHGKDFDFYRASIPLKLPAPDDDLDFQLSPLPIAVSETTAPLRLVSGKHFKPSLILREHGKDEIGNCKLVPSCVQLSMTVKLQSKVTQELQSSTLSVSTACTNGSLPEPKE
ncbi:MAG: hypothetical protein K2X93_03680 [Candidatus Obscuribacterales bacterium]|nr:hypothetical protein [Candidatus Obscuribacterales bacterium]